MNQPTLRRTQQERRAESERKLIEATAQLILERGFGHLSLTAIGERAGYSHGLVNHLFGSKAALIEQLNGTVDELYRNHLVPAFENKKGVDAVVALAEAYLTLVTSSDPLARVHIVAWAQAVAGEPDLRHSHIEWDRFLRKSMATVIARATGRKRTDSYCKTSVVVIVGLLRGVAMQHMLDPASVPLPAAHKRATDAIRALLE